VAKYPVLNNMVLFGYGRVLVVRCIADEKRSLNSLGMWKIRRRAVGDASTFKITLRVGR
jgi:hypothetical protein